LVTVRGRSLGEHPARLVPMAFPGAIVAGTFLMMLPVARTELSHAPW
jgi:trk system potassium uptake protein TrkH